MSRLRATRDELERQLLELERAIEMQRPPQWWEGSPGANKLAHRSAELLQQLGDVNDQLMGKNLGPVSGPV